jgi:hypothetical protein
MVSPKLHQASVWHTGNGDRLTPIVPVGLNTQYQIWDVVGRHSWAWDRVERMELAEKNFDDALSWGTNSPNHCNLADVVDLTCLSDNSMVLPRDYVQIVNPPDHRDKLALM